jgi:hypothetical protein
MRARCFTVRPDRPRKLCQADERKSRQALLNRLDDGLVGQVVEHHNNGCTFVVCRGHQQHFPSIAEDPTGSLTGTADNNARNGVPGSNHLPHARIDDAIAARCVGCLITLFEALIPRISKDRLRMLTDPPKELFFAEGFEDYNPSVVRGKLPYRFSKSPAFQILEKQGIALHPQDTPVLDVCSIGWIDRIFVAEMVDVAIIDFIKIEGAEKAVILSVLNLGVHSIQIKVAPIQGA